MMTPMMGNLLPPAIPWAADTGCFSAPDKFDPLAYMAYLARYRSESGRCLFVTMPDVVGDAKATLAKIRQWPEVIRALGFRPALVAQDGLESLPVPWQAFDVLFIGGTTAWKLGDHATTLIREAKARGKWVHVGRVNSLRRLRHSQWQGADSADGTFLAFGPDINHERLSKWLTCLRVQPALL
jgi:hypothetical protein